MTGWSKTWALVAEELGGTLVPTEQLGRVIRLPGVTIVQKWDSPGRTVVFPIPDTRKSDETVAGVVVNYHNTDFAPALKALRAAALDVAARFGIGPLAGREVGAAI